MRKAYSANFAASHTGIPGEFINIFILGPGYIIHYHLIYIWSNDTAWRCRIFGFLDEPHRIICKQLINNRFFKDGFEQHINAKACTFTRNVTQELAAPGGSYFGYWCRWRNFRKKMFADLQLVRIQSRFFQFFIFTFDA